MRFKNHDFTCISLYFIDPIIPKMITIGIKKKINLNKKLVIVNLMIY